MPHVDIPKSTVIQAANLNGLVCWDHATGSWRATGPRAISGGATVLTISPSMFRHSSHVVRVNHEVLDRELVLRPPPGRNELELSIERFAERKNKSELPTEFFERVWRTAMSDVGLSPEDIRRVDQRLHDALYRQKSLSGTTGIKEVFPNINVGRKPTADPAGERKREQNRLRSMNYRRRKRLAD